MTAIWSQRNKSVCLGCPKHTFGRGTDRDATETVKVSDTMMHLKLFVKYECDNKLSNSYMAQTSTARCEKEGILSPY
jgi:hypothetical protein